MTSKSAKIKAEETLSDSVPLKQYTRNIVWVNVIALLFFHITALYGLLYLPAVKYWTILWAFIVGTATIVGVTAGAHRLWSHRAYKANWPLQFLLIIFQTAAYQGSVYKWATDHRVHHKFIDTDADPYNARRGFFFSHIGWVLLRKHPEVIKKGVTLDYSDLEQNSLVMFQKKYYFYLMFVLAFIIPMFVPWWIWNESLWYSWYVVNIRYCISLHATFLINSAAHMWGMKPYDKSITPTENMTVAILACGEGWHNYHHTFPWDYKAAELGNYSMNISTAFIDFFAFLGWASDLKTASPDIVKKRVLRNNKETIDNKNSNCID